MGARTHCASLKVPLSAANLLANALTSALERRFAVPLAIQTSRAALGLMAVLRCWPRRRNVCRVALSGAVCHDVVVAVLAAGCEPVFCDVDVSDGLVTEAEWIRARSLGADVAIVVHLYGNPAPTKRVRDIFPPEECLVIDDAAQALGSQSADGAAGTQGDVGLLSFGYSKHISLGTAALLFRDPGFGATVGAFLERLTPEPGSARDHARGVFRAQLDAARARLREEGDPAADAFSGLLTGLQPTLHEPLVKDVEKDILIALESYPEAVAARVMKAALWSGGLAGSGMQPVGMGRGCVPWRYACRLPGASWLTQHRLAEALRKDGMHVSNWYLPAHWFLGQGAGSLPGVERLSREVFQFWLDGETSSDSIVGNIALVRREVGWLSK